MTKKELACFVNEKLDVMYKDAKCALNYSNLFELIVAVSLSAQTTDVSVNKSLGLYKNKARNLIALSKELVSKFNGEVPNTMEELEGLSGVGYKTA